MVLRACVLLLGLLVLTLAAPAFGMTPGGYTGRLEPGGRPAAPEPRSLYPTYTEFLQTKARVERVVRTRLREAAVSAEVSAEGQSQGGFVSSLGGSVASMAKGAAAMVGIPMMREPGDVEDCTACRYVWLQVEMDVAEDKVEEDIYDAFTTRCIEAQKAAIFAPACEDMFQAIDDMISDYVDDFTVNQLCEASRICR